MKILVPVKRVADPDNANKVKISGDGKQVTSQGLEWKLNPFDEYAVEAALRLTENAKTGERLGEVILATLGPKDVGQTLRGALAMGADRAHLVEANDDQLDAGVVVDALAKIVAQDKPDLVLMGKQAVDGDSNQTGQMLAEQLGWPMATFAMSIEVVDGGKAVRVGREADGGILTLQLQLPAVVTVDLRIVAPKSIVNHKTPADHTYADTARYASLKGIMAAKKKPIVETTLAKLGVTTTPVLAYSKFELPAGRKAGVKVADVTELVTRLRTEAKAL